MISIHPTPPRRPPRFELGQVVSTPGAVALLQRAGVSAISLLTRHATGDWGDLDAEDAATNELAVFQGQRILSAYVLQVPYPDSDRTSPERIWIITEGDRASTVFLLPSEY